MAKRRENMLEAFKASVDRDSAQEQKLLRAGLPAAPVVPVPPADAPRDPRAASSAARPPLPVRRAAEPSLADLGARALPEEEGLTLPFGLWPFLGLQAVALGLAFFLGTLQGGPATAAAGSGDPALADGSGSFELQAPRGARPGSAPSGAAKGAAEAPGVGAARPDPTRPEAGAAGPDGRTPADRAFDDPANRFTVVVFTADDYPVGRERTWALYEHLAAHGYEPVTPRVVQGRLVLMVSAAPRMGDLEKLKLEVRELLGPDGRTRPFRDAWVNNIDNYK